jgi:hypothetical protein
MSATMTDAEALDAIVARYKSFGQDDIFENPSSTIERIGDIIEQTGRKAWFERAEWEEDDEDADD